MNIAGHPGLEPAVALLESVQLPTSDLTEAHCEHFFFTGPDDAPTGLVGLEVFGDVALLRSLAVAPAARRAGLGTALLSHAESAARARGVRTLYLLTTTAETFFARHGYTREARDLAPPAIRATREFSGICPASSAFMKRVLQGTPWSTDR